MVRCILQDRVRFRDGTITIHSTRDCGMRVDLLIFWTFVSTSEKVYMIEMILCYKCQLAFYFIHESDRGFDLSASYEVLLQSFNPFLHISPE